MTLHNYLLFVLASIVLVIVPGPDMLYMVGRSIAQGRRAGIMAALGFHLGGYVHLTAAMLGLSAVMATSALAFTVVKWIGAGYLVYLGVTALLSQRGVISVDADDARTSGSIFWQAFVSDVLNPKVALFFLALLPQFINPRDSHPTLEILLLGVTVNVIALTINTVIVCFSARLTVALRRNATMSQWLHKAMGAMFVALGLRLAGEKL
jgi:threonine/homoserine/homoserine lactone efflux protein